MSARVAFVGVGNRAQFFFRIIQALPEKFELVGGYARTPENRDTFSKMWNAPAFDDIGKMISKSNPDFVVTSVPWGKNEEVNIAMLDTDVPLLFETPPAGTLKGLIQIYEKAKSRRAPVGMAEQYVFRPYHQLTLGLAQDGLLGEIHYADVSIAHGYHGASVLRYYLGTGLQNPESISGMLHRDRVVIKGEMKEYDQAIALLKFRGGKTGVLNFGPTQYMTSLRPLTIKVRGDRGEFDHYDVHCLNAKGIPVSQTIARDQAGRDGNLDGFFLKGLSFGDAAYWENPYPGARLSDEEIAIAQCMESMASERGPAYPLVEGLHDHHLGLLWQDAAKAGGSIKIAEVPWGE
jgi:predicted dehydrogenase